MDICVSGADSYQDDKKALKEYVLWLLCILIPLGIYMVSNACTVEEHAGATELTLLEALRQNPIFSQPFY